MPDDEELMGAAEIGRLFGVSRQRVTQITSRVDFPAPRVTLTMGKVWRGTDVRRWAIKRGRKLQDEEPASES